MNARFPAPLAGLVVVATACAQPDIAAPRWDALEGAEVRAALQGPTGELADLSSAALEDALTKVAPVLIEVARYLATVVQILAEVSEQQGLEPTPGAPVAGRAGAVGAQAYLELACPGDRTEPPFSFEQGEVRIDSPVLESLADLPVLLEGTGLLLDFRSCLLGDSSLQGEAPALFDARLAAVRTMPSEPQRFGAALGLTGLEYGDRTLPVGIMAFGCAGASMCSERQAVSAQLLAGELGSYTLAFVLTRDLVESPTTLALSLAAADGEAQCLFDERSQRVTCAMRAFAARQGL